MAHANRGGVLSARTFCVLRGLGLPASFEATFGRPALDHASDRVRHLFRDGRIDLVPHAGGFCVARSEILPLGLLVEPPSEENPGGRRIHRVVARARYDRPLRGKTWATRTSSWCPSRRTDAIDPTLGRNAQRSPRVYRLHSVTTSDSSTFKAFAIR